MAGVRGIAWGISVAAAALAHAADASTLWAQKVQPLFDASCVKCHGPMEQKGGLALDSKEAVLRGGEDGKVVVPGRPEKSLLFRYLAPDSDPHMPPKKQLSGPERAAVGEWIAALERETAQPVAVKPPAGFRTPSEAVDFWIADGWRRRGIKPSKAVTDAEWCRRVHLDLADRLPTRAEEDAFLKSPRATRRAALVDRLLASDDYSVRMRELWDVFLMGRPRREAHEDNRRKNGWWAFLEASFRTNRPWNETVRAMLVARPERPEDKGASWFLYERRNNHQAIAEAVAPLVYGTKVDCAQCHDHPLARDVKQIHYWGLVAAFNRSKNLDGGSDVDEGAVGGFINFTNLKKESQPAVITLLDGRKIEEPRPVADAMEEDSDLNYIDAKAKPRTPKFSRRAAFAEAATRGNPLLARAFVNRMWSAFFGRGIVQPADEMNARNSPSHPELLDWLAADFAGHGHDVKRLVRALVLSRAYGLARSTAAPEAFAGALERPLTGEQLARSWRVTAGLPVEDDALRRAAVAALPEVTPRDYNATFQQAQFLTASEPLAAILKPGGNPTAARIAALPDPAARAKAAYLAVYDRAPDAEELAQTIPLLRSTGAGAEKRVDDVLWALMTSGEFLTMP
jgi:mono/diheme cytochrome c family protein